MLMGACIFARAIQLYGQSNGQRRCASRKRATNLGEGMTIQDSLYRAADESEEIRTPARVVVLGSLHLDILVHASDRPKKGETLPGSAWGYKAGGKGGNQAVAAAQFGARASMVGRVGDDDFGKRLLRHLMDAGVDAEYVYTDPEAGSVQSSSPEQTFGCQPRSRGSAGNHSQCSGSGAPKRGSGS